MTLQFFSINWVSRKFKITQASLCGGFSYAEALQASIFEWELAHKYLIIINQFRPEFMACMICKCIFIQMYSGKYALGAILQIIMNQLQSSLYVKYDSQ